MPIRIYWLDEQTKHAIVIEMVDDWVWDDYFAIRKTDLHDRLDSVDAPVPHIYDISQTSSLPPGTFSRMREILSTPHRNFAGDLIVVGAKPLLKSVLNLASELFLNRFDGMNIHFVANFEDVHGKLKSKNNNPATTSKIADQFLSLIAYLDEIPSRLRLSLIISLLILYGVGMFVGALIGFPIPLLGLWGVINFVMLLVLTDIRYVIPLTIWFSGGLFILPIFVPGIYTQQFTSNLWTIPLLYGFVGSLIGIAIALIRKMRVQHDVAILALNELDSMRDELLQSEVRYRELVENTSDVSFTIDTDGHFEYVSTGIELLTGYAPQELIGKHFLMLVDKDYQEIVAEFYITQIQTVTPDTLFDFPISTKTGRKKWVEQRVTMHYQDGKARGIFAIVRDISERQMMAEALQSARDEAVAMAEFKSQILANISHDVRTPLNVISMVVDALQEEFYGEINPQQAEKLKTVSMNIDNVMMLIRNLLDAARLERGVLRLKIDDFTFSKLLKRTASSLEPLVEAKALEWKTSIDPRLPDVMYGDMNRLQQIILNLGHNAIQYTDSGTIELAFIYVDEQQWALKIQDTGAGIAEVAQTYIFDAFWQVDDSFTRKVQAGVGLGLSIVQQLVQMMDGEIQLESTEGKGTTFIITFPLLTEDAIEIPESTLFIE